MSSADIPDDPVDHRVDAAEARRDAVLDAAIEAELETGARETTEQQAKRNIVVRIAIIAAGTLVTLVGVALLALPGPGLIVVALGLGLLATEIPFAARLLDKVTDRLPRDGDGNIPRSAIVKIIVVCTVTVGASTAASIWWSFFRS